MSVPRAPSSSRQQQDSPPPRELRPDALAQGAPASLGLPAGARSTAGAERSVLPVSASSSSLEDVALDVAANARAVKALDKGVAVRARR